MERTEARRGRGAGERWFTTVLVVAVVLLAAEMVLLIRQNRMLRASLARMSAESAAAVAPALEAGTVLGPLKARTLDGAEVRIAYDDPGRMTVLLIFSPDCPACRGNMERWKGLVAEHGADDGTRFYYVSTTDRETTSGFAEEFGLAGTVVVAEGEALVEYEIHHIPTTIVVGPGGVVRDVVVGAVPAGWPSLLEQAPTAA